MSLLPLLALTVPAAFAAKSDKQPPPALEQPATEENAREDIEWSCGGNSVSGRIVERNTGETIPLSSETAVYVQHKQDIDAHEDRCITQVTIAHQPERGCAYEFVFGATSSSPALLLQSASISADSFCPGWNDNRETGDPAQAGAYRYLGRSSIPLSMSRRQVPDRTADTSCTELQLSASGTLRLQRMAGMKPSPQSGNFRLDDLRLTGEYLSAGDPSASCPPDPEPPRAPAPAREVKQARIAVLGHIGTALIPTLPGAETGADVLVEIKPSWTVTTSAGFSAYSSRLVTLDNRWVLGDPNSAKLRPVGGLRLGQLRTGSEYYGDQGPVAGLLLGVETSRARTSPFYATADVSAFIYSGSVDVMTTYIDELISTPGGVAATLRVGSFIGRRDID